MKQEGSSTEFERGDSVGSQKTHEVSMEKSDQDGLTLIQIPLASQTSLFTSSDSIGSSCSDSSVDFSSDIRDNESRMGNGPNDRKTKINHHLQQSSSFTINEPNKQDDEPTEEEGIETLYPFYEFWVPPEAVIKEDDEENSVVAADDDDDDGDEGINWGSSVSGFEYGEKQSYQSKENKEKAMTEVRNGKFRSLVSRLLKTVGVMISDHGSEGWVDVISSLSWRAACFVKPDARKGKAMDPAGYVKVKCVASGYPAESKLIKGLVFKKHAAHKHMPTEYKNPRLLLIQGMLGQSTGLSSFNSMIPQGQDQDKPLHDKLEACNPNVVLVEKSASRNLLEELLQKRITLVIDMKLHRLERIAQCTGSPILSADTMLSQKLKQCDSLYFEKFLEEHEESIGGKKPGKTLMFVEGSPTRLGCTILLKGSRSEELKKIKCVVHCAVVMAYHFILETSFLLDQEAMFSTIGTNGVVEMREEIYSQVGFSSFSSRNRSEASLEDASADKSNAPPCNEFHEECSSDKKSSGCSKYVSVDIPIAEDVRKQTSEIEGLDSVAVPSSAANEIPISGGLVESGSQMLSSQWKEKSEFLCQPEIATSFSELSSISASIEEVVKKNLPTAYPSMRPYLCLGESISDTEETSRTDTEVKGNSSEQMLVGADNDSFSFSSESVTDSKKVVGEDQEGSSKKDDISTVMDSESILVLMSSRNAKIGTICEQSHFSHIKFYKNFDVPLGQFLRDNLLSQNLPCRTCKGQPEAHFYYYSHHNKQLTIRVKRIPDGIHLPGESEGKLWMWSRCGKCKPVKEASEKCTKRVLISSVARGLSFGKFLELTFSNHSSFNRLSKCGHSLHRDFLHFFGSGPMVAMFRYSTVVTYTVSVPPRKMEFSSSNKQWLHKETEWVYTRTMLLFTEVANYLKRMEPQFRGLPLNINVLVKEFNDIEKMLVLERHEFEENIKKACIENSPCVRTLLCLNRLRWELLLEACIWNRRLQLLLSSGSVASYTAVGNKVLPQEANVGGEKAEGEKEIEITEGASSNPGDKQTSSLKGDEKFPNNNTDMEIPVESFSGQNEVSAGDISCTSQKELNNSPVTEKNIQELIADNAISSSTLHDDSNAKDCTSSSCDEESQTENNSNTSNLSKTGCIHGTDSTRDGSPVAGKTSLVRDTPQLISNIESSKGRRIWNPYSQIREECMKELHQKGNLPSFQDSLRLDTVHSPDSLPNLTQIMSEEGPRLHIPICNDDYIVSDFEGEISSVVASALSVILDMPSPLGIPGNDDDSQGSKESSSVPEEFGGLSRTFSEPYPIWSLSNSFQESDMLQTASSFSLAHSRLPSFDGLNFLDSFVSFGAAHRLVSLGLEKNPGKGKYSVVCIFADKFRELRDRCCPSELDYIASLCRCKNWDAKGGKSKSLFAKTLDERLIIKEIRRTELESFMKFSTEYFHHMQQSVDAGNQTCLAKILGIYQVTIRPPKTGKETKHDLMVMENLSFGRTITRQYDLKGAMHARFTAASDGSGDVLLDQNFVLDMYNSPLHVGQKAKRLLQRAVWNDTTFLNTINVMDYSLLVGVDMQRRELVCGIIDYLRQYTWDKQLETWVKTSLVVPKNVLPTIISPKEYKKRFRKFMDTHFLTVPDRWCSQRSTPCKLCGIGGDSTSSSSLKSEDSRSSSHPA